MAKDKYSGGMFAIKAVSKKRLKRKSGLIKGSRKSSGLLDLEREVSILTQIRHPNVVRLVEVMNDPEHDSVYMVFELLKVRHCLAVARATACLTCWV